MTTDELERATIPHRRRTILKAAGVGATLSLLGGVASAQNHGRETPTQKRAFGTAGTSDDNAPQNYDHEVEVFTDEGFLLHTPVEEDGETVAGPPVGVEFGMFGFDPVGLHVSPGDVVKFAFSHPEHAVVSYHGEYGRQRRIPSGATAFSSPFLDAGGFWLYRFETPGVYDVFCPPHEEYGMGMRLVVGDETTPDFSAGGRPPAGLAALLFGTDPLDPAHVAQVGRVPFDHAANAMVPDPTAPAGDIRLGELALPISLPTTAASLGTPGNEFES